VHVNGRGALTARFPSPRNERSRNSSRARLVPQALDALLPTSCSFCTGSCVDGRRFVEDEDFPSSSARWIVATILTRRSRAVTRLRRSYPSARPLLENSSPWSKCAFSCRWCVSGSRLVGRRSLAVPSGKPRSHAATSVRATNALAAPIGERLPNAAAESGRINLLTCGLYNGAKSNATDRRAVT